MRYVCLLRGINVGGKAPMKMAELRAAVEELGLERVSTYIASGNVLFETGQADLAELEARIEDVLERRFALPVKVVVLDRPRYARVVEAVPRPWIDDAGVRANVAFVRRGSDAAEIVRALEPDAAVEEVKAVEGAILWATRRDALGRSVMRKLIAGAAYKELTVRNLRTALKLHELLAS